MALVSDPSIGGFIVAGCQYHQKYTLIYDKSKSQCLLVDLMVMLEAFGLFFWAILHPLLVLFPGYPLGLLEWILSRLDSIPHRYKLQRQIVDLLLSRSGISIMELG
jgi:hypothetical protein